MFTVRLIVALALLFLMAEQSAHALNRTCRRDGGDLECRGPIIGEYYCLADFATTSAPTCDLEEDVAEGYGGRCSSEGAAWDALIQNMVDGGGEFCAGPSGAPISDLHSETKIFGVTSWMSTPYTAVVGVPTDTDPPQCIVTYYDPRTNYPYPLDTFCHRDVICPAGYLGDPTDSYCFRIKPETCKDGNPIQCAGGEKVQTENDLQGGGEVSLEFVRYYNSAGFFTPMGGDVSIGGLGQSWRHTYQRNIVVDSPSAPSLTIAYAVRPNGDYRDFILTGDQWVGRSDAPERLMQLTDSSGSIVGWEYTDAADTIELYDATGRLLSIASRDGRTKTLAYSDDLTPPEIAPIPGLLIQVTDDLGRYIGLRYDSDGKLREIIDPANRAYTYRYDAGNGLLTFVDYPDGKTREYIYNESTEAPYGIGLLTGILDENGTRFATYTYDIRGRVVSERHGDADADKLSIEYGDLTAQDTSSTLTDSLGVSRTRHFSVDHGAYKDVGTTRSCSDDSCVSASTAATFDSAGYVSTSTDFNGSLTTYVYDDDRGLEISRTEASNDNSALPATRTVQTSWHPLFRLPVSRKISDGGGALQSEYQWEYNARGQVVARCILDASAASNYVCSFGTPPDPALNVRRWTYTYCEDTDVQQGICPIVGLLTSTDGPRSSGDSGMTGVEDRTTYIYYSSDDLGCPHGGDAPDTLEPCTHRRGDLWKTVNALGQVNEVVTYDPSGRKTRIKDVNGTYIDVSYDERGRLTDRIVRANASGNSSAGDSAIYVTYDGVGEITRVTDADGIHSTFSYDNAHRLIAIEDQSGNAILYCPGGAGSSDCLDGVGNRRIEETVDSSGAVKRTIRRNYNALNQLVEVLSSNGTVTTSYPSDSGYDANGNPSLSFDGLGYGTQRTYDTLNRLRVLTQNYEGGDPNTKNTTSEYTYDVANNIRSIVDPDGLVTTYSVDGIRNLAEVISPDTGDTHYSYDHAGNRIGRLDNAQVSTSYVYDVLNRLTNINFSTTTPDISFSYDEANNVTGCASSYPIGHLTTMIDGSGTTKYCYDRRGNVVEKKQVTSGLTFDIRYSYTVGDRLASIQYPQGLLTYSRDSSGRITSASFKATPVVSGVTYYPFGPINTLSFSGGYTVVKNYDQDYLITEIRSSFTGGLNENFMTNVNRQTTSILDPQGTSPSDRSYLYDPLGRLMEADTNGTPSVAVEAYVYDKSGDRQSAALNGGLPLPYLYAAGSHRLASVGGIGRSYDEDGNTKTGVQPSMQFSYDDQSHLTSVSQSPNNYLYDFNGRGERVKKTVTTKGSTVATYFVYDEHGLLLGEYNGTGGLLAQYIYIGSLPVAVVRSDGIYYIEADHLGTPRTVISGAQNKVVWKWETAGSAFGTNAPDSDPDADGHAFAFNLRFPGQYYDAETGLSYNYHRDYESTTGRYVEPDPLGLRAGPSEYAYVGSDPINNIDINGLIAWKGEMYSVAGADIGGGGVYLFDLKSDCIDNHYVYTHVFASGVGPGAGYDLIIPGAGGGPVTFEDGYFDIDPTVFNGKFQIFEAGAGVGIIGSYQFIELGSAISTPSLTPSPSIGLNANLSALAFIGASAGFGAEKKECKCSDIPGQR